MAARTAPRRSTSAPRGRSRRKAAPARQGPGLVATAFVLMGLVVLLGLGAWQLQRKAWKEHLLSRIAALQTAPAEPLNVVLNRLKDGGEVDFVRVVAPCEGLGERRGDGSGHRSAHLYGLRESGGPGWRQVVACRLPDGGAYGSLLVDAGYEATAPMAPPESERLTLPPGARITGVLRVPEPPPWYAGLIGENAQGAARSQASGQWFKRDIPGMAAALDAPRPAPVMLLLESPAAGPKLQPSPLPTDILPAVQHLQYALTWFGLAGVLAVFYAVSLFRSRPARR